MQLTIDELKREPLAHFREILATYPELDGAHSCCSGRDMIDQHSFEHLVADISQGGLRTPIVLTRSRKLVDGRGRLLACFVLGIGLRLEMLPEDVSAWQYCWSVNLCRAGVGEHTRTQFRQYWEWTQRTQKLVTETHGQANDSDYECQRIVSTT
jgi:hypothetical protein